MIGIIIGNLFLGVGEICIIPVILTAISRKAPPNLQSTFMGLLFIFTAFGGILSGQLAQWDGVTTFFYPAAIAEYFNKFLGISLIAMTISLFLFSVSGKINKQIAIFVKTK